MNDDKVILVVTGQDASHEFEASKEALSHCSPYFRAMFGKGFAEENQSKVSLKDVSPLALGHIIDFISGKEEDWNFELVLNVIIETANFLQIDSVVKRCSELLITKFTVENVIDVIDVAEDLSLCYLLNKSMAFAVWNFDKLIDYCDGFSKISYSIMKKLISQCYQKTTAEKAIDIWVNADQESRSQFREELKKHIKHIRMPKFPCCIGRYKKSPYIFMYDQDESNLKPFLSLNAKATLNDITACGFQVASTGISLFIVGGEFSLGRGNWNSKIWKYDTITEEWASFNLENPRRHHSLAVNEDTVYIIGGFGRHRVISDKVEFFKDNSTDIKSSTSLPEPLFGMATFWHREKLHVIKNQFNSFAFDPIEDKWCKVYSQVQFPTNVEFNFALVHCDEVYLTTRHGFKLFRLPLEDKEKVELTEVGTFQSETQNVCLVDGIIYNFSSDQFDYYSTIERYDITKGHFDLLFKTEDEEIDFSPYFSFGCFPLVNFPCDKF